MKTGKNVTGIGTSPIDSKKTIEFAQQCPVTSGDEYALKQARENYAKETENGFGSIPAPATVKGLAHLAMDAFKGQKAAVFINLLGERLAFERTGVRLYDAVIAKFDACGGFDGGPTREDLMSFREAELRHFALVHDAIEKLGGDPTVMTPNADIVGVQATGLLQVVSDPRTCVEQCLLALLTAELVDNDGWAMLIELADAMGHDDMAEAFEEAKREEDHHLASMRQWLSAFVGSEAHVEMPVPPPAPPASPVH